MDELCEMMKGLSVADTPDYWSVEEWLKRPGPSDSPPVILPSTISLSKTQWEQLVPHKDDGPAITMEEMHAASMKWEAVRHKYQEA